jgi:hypothetical protein
VVNKDHAGCQTAETGKGIKTVQRWQR